MPKLLIKIIWITVNIYFPSGSLEFWYMLIRKYLHDQHTIKALVADCVRPKDHTKSLSNYAQGTVCQ